MKKNFHLLFILIAIFITPVIYSQDVHFSQFYMTPLQQNPALSGYQHNFQAIINYKNQWRSVASPYNTLAASFDMKLNQKKPKKGYGALGVSFFNDRAGDSKMGTTQGNLSLAYHVLLNTNNSLGGGLMAGFAQRSISSSNLQWASQYDGFNYNAALPQGEPQGLSSYTYPDIGAGMLWAFNKPAQNALDNNGMSFNLGASVFHLNQPNDSYYGTAGEKLHPKLVVHGDGLVEIPHTNFALVPGFIFYSQGAQREINVGSMFKWYFQKLITMKDNGYNKNKIGAMSLGAYYRNKDAVIITGLFEYSNYAIGISYDINTSNLAMGSNGRGGMEITLRLVNPNPFHSRAQ